jgi:hypothetical protein
VARLDALIEGPFRAAMTRAGFYRHHRQWRRRGKVDDSTSEDAFFRFLPGSKEENDAWEEDKARRLFDRADDVPALIERLGGSLAKRVREQLIARVTKDFTVRELIRREAEMMRRDLEGGRPSAIERLVVERILVAWLYLARCDLLAGASVDDLDCPQLAAHLGRMRDAADRNYLASLKALAQIRRAAPAVTVNVTRNVTVRRGGRQDAPAPCPLAAGARTAGAKNGGGRLAGVVAGRN